MERPHNRVVTGVGPNEGAAGGIVVSEPTPKRRRPPKREKAQRVELTHVIVAHCRRCDTRWSTRNAAAVASVHAAAFGHRVTVKASSSMTFVGARPARANPGRKS